MKVYQFCNESLNIDYCYISKCVNSDNYNFNSIEKLHEINEYNLVSLGKHYDKFKDSLYFNNNIVYLKFIVNCEIDVITTVCIHNNYKNVKMWHNNEFIYSTNDWFDRAIFKMKKGLNNFIFEIKDFERYSDLYISFFKYGSKIFTIDNKVFLDDYTDVKEYYIELDNDIVDTKGNINFIIKTNNCLIKKENVNVFFLEHDLDKVNTSEEYKLIDNISVKTFEKSTFEIEYIFNKIQNKFVLIAINKNGNDEFKNINECFTKRIFLSDFSYDKVEKLINRINVFMPWQWEYVNNYNKLFSLKKSNILGINFYNKINHLKMIKTVSESNTEKDYLLSSGIKLIPYISNLDENVSEFSLYVPERTTEFKKNKLVIILSSAGVTAHIAKFVNKIPKDYIVVEVSVRGKNFGNYIADNSVLEVYKIISGKLNIDEKNVYLIGHSSNGTTAGTLLSRYPEVFKAALVFSCLNNLDEFNNINNNLLFNVAGEKEDFIKLNYDDKIIYQNKLNNFINVQVKNYDSAMIILLLNNGEFLNYFLKYKLLKTQPSYYTFDNLYFSKWKHFNVIEKINPNESCTLSYDERNNVLVADNVKKICVNDLSGELFIKTKTNEKKITLNKKAVYLDISKEISELKEEIHNEELFKRKLEILNIFNDKLYIVCNKEKNVSANIIKKFKNPKSLIHDTKIYIDYPTFYINSDEFIIKNKTNYVLFNFDIEKITNSKLINCINCYNDGFEYKGKFYSGKYSIIQIIPNLLSIDNLMLLINHNDNDYNNKNFFLRNFIIPSDLSRNNSYLRNFAIIYYNFKYYFISHIGGDLEEI